MRDQHDQDSPDQDEVEIEDLGTPDNGLSRYIFTLGKKWQAAALLRGRLVATLVALALLIAVLQPGSSGTNTRTPGTPHAVPGSSSSSTIYLIDCGITVNVNSLPSNVVVWEQVMSTPAAQECSFFSRPGSQCPPLRSSQQQATTPPGQKGTIDCSVGTPSRSGNPGKNH